MLPNFKTLPVFDELLMNVLAAKGVDPIVIYVYKKTGLLITEAAAKNLSDEQITDAKKAANEYRLLEKEMSQTVH